MIASLTVRSQYVALYERQKLRQASDNTRRLHLITLDKFDRFLGRDALLDDLTDDTVADFVWWIHKTEGRSERTANRCRDNLLAQWRYYARKAIVPKWPDVAPLREPQRIPIAWTRDELRKLFGAIDALSGSVERVPASVWWHSLHAVLWDCGERIGAAMQLDWRTVDLAGRYVTFRAETRKGKARDVIHRIHPTTAALLERNRVAQGNPPQGRVWPWAKCVPSLYIDYRKILTAAGLPHDRMRKFHCMRRSAASYLEAAGGNATDFLDHADRRTTKKSYLDLRITGEAGTAVCDVLPRPE